MQKITDERKVELIATLLEAQIANIGHPVGCGIAPHRETLERMAQYCLKVAQATTERQE